MQDNVLVAETVNVPLASRSKGIKKANRSFGTSLSFQFPLKGSPQSKAGCEAKSQKVLKPRTVLLNDIAKTSKGSLVRGSILVSMIPTTHEQQLLFPKLALCWKREI